ncbi:glycosyltransferase family 4 protein [Flavobacterium taihuense]|uniref:Glycosyltransferase family 4 protein n=1 Tax=Flavobacterium taihuense TaxID=2857508 RepID=A0ABS6XUI3_9FLAO|nr:glycosyltransferase family 4 protein [Flavobacterium taihuense]MBW4360341.1 glycosyltransferase family 4 protein [Flavobacterium taihuense]
MTTKKDRKATILYVHHAGGFGGAPKSMGFIIKDLDKSKFYPVLVNIEDGPINEFFETLPVKLIKVNGIKPFHGSTVVEKDWKLFLRNWIFLIPSILKASKLLKEIKPDLIHLNSTCLFSFAIAARLNNIKIISHVREPLRKGLWGAPLRFFCKKYIDGFIAISKFDLESLKISSKTEILSEVIYNFVEDVDMNTSYNSIKTELNLNEEDVVFLYLARFAKSNGWKQLVTMGLSLTEKYKNFHFVLVGAQNKLQLNYVNHKNIHILPFRRDVSSILKSSDVFVCPFTEPHFARGIIEASAHGLPIIGVNIGGVNELVLENTSGFLYKNSPDFQKCAVLLGEDKQLRKKMGKDGIAFSKQNFNMKVNLERTYRFYDNYLK